jgi:acetolactate synthase-1/2/3 large subunit
MAETIRGAELMVRALKQAGVTRVFSLSGNHIMPVYDALFASGIEIIHTRHEAAAVHMADAWARLTGECGVALVTGGQGHTNAVAGLPTAQAGEVPVLLLSGHAPLGELGLGAFQELEQAQMAEPLCKAAFNATSAEAIAEDVAQAISLARSGRPGPVHLSLPTDVLEARVEPPALPGAEAFAPVPMPLSPEAATTIAGTIGAAQRPVLVVPPALCTQAGQAAVAALAARIGLPVVPMESPRGLGDPSLGAYAQVLGEADLVVLLGKALDFTLKFGRAPAIAPDARFVVVEPEQAVLARAVESLGARIAVTAMAGAAEAVAALTAAATPHANTAWGERLGAHIAYRPAAWAALAGAPAGPIHPATLCQALLPFLDAGPDTVLVSDGGEIGQWAQAILSAPARLINGVAGAIGPSIPFALAARCARPDARILAVLGDGTFGFHMAEFDTAHRHGLPFVAVVGNDARWNAEHQIQLREYGAARAHGCELAPGTRYDLVVAALGGHGEFVTRSEELAPALERAFASGKPACVNVLIDGQAAPTIRMG